MNDQEIGAFLDRELDGETRAAQARNIEENTGYAMRLRVFKKADDLLREAVPPFVTPGDHALSQRILNAEAIGRPAPLRLARKLAPFAAACLMGVLVGLVASTRPSPLPLRSLSGAVLSALDTTPSGQTRTTTAGTIAVAITVRMDSGLICRQFSISDRNESSEAIACREGGTWRLVAAENTIPATRPGYRVASGDSAQQNDKPDTIGQAILVNEDEERLLLADGWVVR